MKALAKWIILLEIVSTALLVLGGYLVNWLDPPAADEWISRGGGFWFLAFLAWLVAQCALAPATVLSLIYLALDWAFGWSERAGPATQSD
jgi:hypothetical protein